MNKPGKFTVAEFCATVLTIGLYGAICWLAGYLVGFRNEEKTED